ncbi:MAG: flippase-like domain-containing protein [Muribaculaceae bacterium]|nr:flippase-like domain-containing protein [Muribaculaceae bacterium]
MNKTASSRTGILLKYVVPLIISVGLCWLLFKGMDLKEMWRVMKAECNFRWMWGNLLFMTTAHVCRALRWQIQLRALGIKAGLWELTLSIFGTYSVNLVLPRLGEVWRCGFVAQRQKAPFTQVFGSMVADRLADTISVALITFFTFTFAGTQLKMYLSQDPEQIESIKALVTSPVLWGAVGACFVFAVWMLVKYPENRVIASIRHILKGLWEGFAVIATMPHKGWWLLWTVGIWGSFILSMWFAFQSFPLIAQLSDIYGLRALMICFTLTSISMAVPSNGGIGPYQWAMIFGLQLYASGVPGLDYGYSAAFANMLMGTETIYLIFLGLITFGWIALTKKKK